MSNLENRIAASFEAQGLMATLGATLEHVEDGEVRIAMPFAKNAGRQLAVCTGEVRAFTSAAATYKVVALMRATVVNVAK